MTIFEQTINTSQVQMESSSLGIGITVFICCMIAMSSIYFYGTILDYQLDYEVSGKMPKSKSHIIIVMITGISVFIGGAILVFSMPFYLPGLIYGK